MPAITRPHREQTSVECRKTQGNETREEKKKPSEPPSSNVLVFTPLSQLSEWRGTDRSSDISNNFRRHQLQPTSSCTIPGKYRGQIKLALFSCARVLSRSQNSPIVPFASCRLQGQSRALKVTRTQQNTDQQSCDTRLQRKSLSTSIPR